MPTAPVAITASATTALISSSDICCGRYLFITSISNCSFAARSARFAAVYCSTESRRCFTSLAITPITRSSVGSTRSSTSRCFTAASKRRMAESFAVSCAFMASFMSAVICSLRVISHFSENKSGRPENSERPLSSTGIVINAAGRCLLQKAISTASWAASCCEDACSDA